MRDLSFGVVNSAFAQFTGVGAGQSVTIYKADLSDQGNPLQFEPADISGFVPDLNGNFIVYRKAFPIQFSFTLLPYTHSDVALINFLYACSKPMADSTIAEAVVQMSDTATITYTDGTLISGIPGVGANAEGRMESHTYRFMFSAMKLQGYKVRRGLK